MNDWTIGLPCMIFAVTYAGLALGKVPGLRIDRAGIALVGVTLMLVAGVLSLEQAVSPESIEPSCTARAPTKPSEPTTCGMTCSQARGSFISATRR